MDPVTLILVVAVVALVLVSFVSVGKVSDLRRKLDEAGADQTAQSTKLDALRKELGTAREDLSKKTKALEEARTQAKKKLKKQAQKDKAAGKNETEPESASSAESREEIARLKKALDAMEVQVTLSRIDPDGPDGGLTDRWRIYHGDPPDAHWARAEIDAARFGQVVIDGEALMRPNPLAEVEARLCRETNREHRSDLVAMCRRRGTDVQEPLLVGIDPLGFDVRRRFDVARVPADEPMGTAADVERVLGLMCADG